MFKLACFTDEISQDLATAIAVCKEYELDGVEIRSVWDKPPQELSDDDVARIKDMLGEAGLATCCIASPFFKCDLGNEAEYEEHLRILRRCIWMGQQLGTNIVRGFTFWKKGPLTDEVFQQILEAYKEPVNILASEGAILGIENEASTYLGAAHEVKRFIDALGSEHVRAIWDPCNELFAENGETPYPDGYSHIKNDIVHVHIKDAGPGENGELTCLRIGDGLIDYPGQFQALIDDGYEGYASLETHWRPKALTKEQVDRPGGAAYSENAEQASRQCLDRIKEILASLRSG